jgi:Arc/MetJ family transcription regulator
MGRTNIVIDDALIRRVMNIFGVRTKREAVALALKQAADRAKSYEALRAMRGKFHWEGDIDAWRRSRV